MPNENQLNWKIGGASGMGIKSVGEIMAKVIGRVGFWVHGYTEYPSLIKGGHNIYQIWADKDGPATAPGKELTLLVVLNQESLELHKEELTRETIVVADQGLKTDMVKAKVLSLPILEAAKEAGDLIAQNVVSLGVSAAELGIDKTIFEDLIREQFGKKEELLEVNLKAFNAGWQMHPNPKEPRLKKTENNRLVLTGNEALAMGAICAGVQLYVAYPMTPSTPVLHYLAETQEKFGFLVRQTEDEIAAINMAIGASFAGAKAMTGTSGGGFALMTEAMALSGMLELPLVVYVGMRGGPATGLPTWTAQGDLRFVIHSGHGEYPKIVLAPGDPTEAYELTYKAFELAQKYQTVVVVLMDKHLAESHYSVEVLSKKPPVALMNIEWQPNQPEGEFFHRYQPSPNGVSDRTLPGIKNGMYIANSDEHGPEGLADETAPMRIAQTTKRLLKLKAARDEMAKPILYGQDKANLTLVGFGSTKGSVLEAMKDLADVNFLHFTHVWPLPFSLTKTFEQFKKIAFIENNLTGQFQGLIREETGVDTELSLRKDDGRPFYAEEIIDFVKQL